MRCYLMLPRSNLNWKNPLIKLCRKLCICTDWQMFKPSSTFMLWRDGTGWQAFLFLWQGCILPLSPGPWPGWFFCPEKNWFRSNATFLFSKNKWKTRETDKCLHCLTQQVKTKRGYLNSKTVFLANSWLLRNGHKLKISEWNASLPHSKSLSILKQI